MPSTFITARAAALIELNGIVDANKEPMGDRFVHLMEHPEDRDKEIARDCIGQLTESILTETDNIDEAETFADRMTWFAETSFAAVSELPLPQRGLYYSTGRAVIDSICDRQAWLESVGIEALEIGTGMGVLNKTAAKRMTTPAKREMAKEGGLKKSLNDLEAAAKSDKIGE